MNEILLEAFRHSAWATKQLLAVCRGLAREQVTGLGTAAGTEVPGGQDWSRERNILSLFNHIVRADRGYVSRSHWRQGEEPGLRGDRPEWADTEEDPAELDELERRAEENAGVWERFLSQPVDPKRLLVLDDGAYEAEQSVLVVQALHHSHIHLEQISAILTGLGLEPPDIQAWSYAEASNHARPRSLA